MNVIDADGSRFARWGLELKYTWFRPLLTTRRRRDERSLLQMKVKNVSGWVDSISVFSFADMKHLPS